MALTVWGSGVWLVIKKKPECSKVTYSINVATTFKLATVGFSTTSLLPIVLLLTTNATSEH